MWRTFGGAGSGGRLLLAGSRRRARPTGTKVAQDACGGHQRIAAIEDEAHDRAQFALEELQDHDVQVAVQLVLVQRVGDGPGQEGRPQGIVGLVDDATDQFDQALARQLERRCMHAQHGRGQLLDRQLLLQVVVGEEAQASRRLLHRAASRLVAQASKPAVDGPHEVSGDAATGPAEVA